MQRCIAGKPGDRPGVPRHVAEGDAAACRRVERPVVRVPEPVPSIRGCASTESPKMSFPVLRRSLLSASLLVALSPAAHAAEDPTLPEVVVTATRTETPRAEVLAAVTVLDRAAIERSQAADVLELLGRQPGVDVVRTGGPGSLSTLNLRGGNSNHTLVLIDGLRMNSAVQGLFDLAHLPLAQVERIEIVRGPRAALWGSDAIGGVV